MLIVKWVNIIKEISLKEQSQLRSSIDYEREISEEKLIKIKMETKVKFTDGKSNLEAWWDKSFIISLKLWPSLLIIKI